MKKALIYSAVLGAMIANAPVNALEFDGFLTAGFAVHNQTQTDGSKVIFLDEIKEDVTFLQDSKFGLQVTADVADDMQVVAQILASAEDENYQMDIEWAYLDYSLSDSTSFRMGRIKQPVFLISDYLEVGYAYPWIRPPGEAYSNMPVDSIIGVELLYQADLGGMRLGIQPYFGSNTEAVPGQNNVNFFADNYIGIAFRLENPSFTFQVTTFQTDVSTVDSGAGVDHDGNAATPLFFLNSEGTATLSVASLSMDMANFVAYAEFTTRDIEPDQDTLGQSFNGIPFDALFSDQDGFYVTLGYRMGKYLPHITYSTIDSEPGGTTAQGYSQGDRQDSVTFGLRYEINDSTALKMEYQQVELEEFTGNDGLYNGVSSALEEEKASIISASLDVIF